MRFGRTFFIIIILICILETARFWLISPTQMAAHFNAAGVPDRFTTREQFFGFQLQTMIVVIGLGLVFQLLVVFLPVDRIKLPNRTYWLAPERRGSVVDHLNGFVGFLFGIILLTVQVGFDLAASANLHDPIRFNAQGMLLCIVGFLVASMLLLFWFTSSFKIPPADREVNLDEIARG